MQCKFWCHRSVFCCECFAGPQYISSESNFQLFWNVHGEFVTSNFESHCRELKSHSDPNERDVNHSPNISKKIKNITGQLWVWPQTHKVYILFNKLKILIKPNGWTVYLPGAISGTTGSSMIQLSPLFGKGITWRYQVWVARKKDVLLWPLPSM